MCLAIPARVVTIEEGGMASVDIMGVTRKVSLDLVPEASDGDFVSFTPASHCRSSTRSTQPRHSRCSSRYRSSKKKRV